MLANEKERDSTPMSQDAAAAGEGVVQFRYELQTPNADDSLDRNLLNRLERWRVALLEAGLIGRDPERYQGYAFGNLSARDPERPPRFVITASQRTDAARFDPHDWVRIDAFDLDAFSVVASGHRAPSSESLTHAMVYSVAAHVRCVLHVHSPAIWSHGATLGLPATGAATPYGSHALARDVEHILEAHHDLPIVFTTPGHEDGVFACGTDLDATGEMLLALARNAEKLQ